MVVSQLSSSTLEKLQGLLEQMNVCAQRLEEITQQEYDAIRSLDADQIMMLADQRILAHQAMKQLENNCRTMLGKEGIADDLSLEVVIDMRAGKEAARFQALRRNLYERIVKIDKSSQENHLRMQAAHNVSSSILQQLGLAPKPEQTYSRRQER